MLNVAIVVPEIYRVLTVSDITQTSITLLWSIGNTQHFDHIHVDQTSSSGNRRLNASSNSSHTATALTPGTVYEFYVLIQSYGNTARTDTTTVTTGATLSTH